MAAQKRSQKIAELEEKLSSLEELLEQLDEAEEEAAAAILGRSGYLSPQEIKSDILKATQALRKAKGESNGNEDKADVSGADKYPLVSVPDEILTPEQVCVCAVIMGFCSCAVRGMLHAYAYLHKFTDTQWLTIAFLFLYQLKEKKKQVFLKITTEGKMRAKQRRAEEEALKEKQEEQRRV
jgi:actin-related protein 5